MCLSLLPLVRFPSRGNIRRKDRIHTDVVVAAGNPRPRTFTGRCLPFRLPGERDADPISIEIRGNPHFQAGTRRQHFSPKPSHEEISRAHRIPTGSWPPAQGCRTCEATLGYRPVRSHSNGSSQGCPRSSPNPGLWVSTPMALKTRPRGIDSTARDPGPGIVSVERPDSYQLPSPIPFRRASVCRSNSSIQLTRPLESPSRRPAPATTSSPRLRRRPSPAPRSSPVRRGTFSGRPLGSPASARGSPAVVD